MATPPFARPHAMGCLLSLKVVPGASRARIVGVMADGVLKITVSKPPAGGQANEAVLNLLALSLSVPRRSVQLVQGQATSRKTLLIHGLTPVEVQRLLQEP